MKKILGILLALSLLTGLVPALAADEGIEMELPDFEITSDVVTLLCWNSQREVDVEGGTYYEVNKLMQERYGCSLKIIRTTYEELADKAASLALSNETPDLIFYKGQDFPNFINKGLVQEVSEYLDFSLPIWADLKDTADSFMYKGGYYFFPYTKLYNNSYIYYWTDFFEDAGLETPAELYAQGEWTLSRMRELMYDLTVDSDRDGIVDVYGMAMHPIYSYYITGEDFVTQDQETGIITNNLRSPALTPFFDFMYNTSSAVDGTRLQAYNTISDFTARKAAMTWEEEWVMGELAEYIRNGEVDFAPSPRLDGSDVTYAGGRVNGYWIGKDCANPGGAAAFLACSRYVNASKEYAAYRQARSETRYGYTAEQEALLDEMRNSDKFVFLRAPSLGVGNWGYDAMWVLWSDVGLFEVPWSSTVEKFYPILQEEIDITNAANVTE